MGTGNGSDPVAGSNWMLGAYRVRPTLNLVEAPAGEEEIDSVVQRRVSPKAMAVLVALAARPGEVFSKQQLLDDVWEERFVSEGVLHNTVAELRQALDDSARTPWAIETIHGTGYRLLVAPSRQDSEFLEPSSQPEISPSEVPAPQPLYRRLSWRVLALLLFVVALALLALVLYRAKIGCRGEAGSWVVEDAESCASLSAFLLAREAYDRGDEELAKRELQQVTETDSNFVHAWYYLASLYDRRDSKDKAREKVAAARSAAERKGPYFGTLLDRRLAQINGDWAAERDELEDLASWDQSNPEWPLALGFGYLSHRADCANGLEFHRRAAELGGAGRYQRYYCEAAASCLGSQQAVSICRQALEGDRESFETLILLGELEIASGDLATAERHLEEAEKLSQGDSRAFLALGEIAYLRQDLAAAAELFSAAGRGNLDDDFDERALRRLGALMVETGRLEEAQAIAERMKALRQPSFETAWLRGRVALAHGQPDLAREVLREARREVPEGSFYQVEWLEELEGWIELDRGLAAKAIAAFERALDLSPFDPSRTRTALAQALIAAGEPEKARAELRTVLAANPAYWPAADLLEDLTPQP